MKLDLTAFHHPSILLTRFFFFLLPFPLEMDSAAERTELPEVWRGRSKNEFRFCVGDRVGSRLDIADRIERLRRRNRLSTPPSSSRDVDGVKAMALEAS
jgi:hypothetical protein